MQQETIDHIRDGDLDAYEAVVRKYQEILLGNAAHRLPDVNVAQDVVQLTFIRAYQQLDEFQIERDFGVWLCVICKHFILTELERQRRETRNLEKYSHRLTQTDLAFGSEASHYEFPGRGIETPSRIRRPGAGRDRMILSKDRFSSNLKLHCSVHLDQIRVIVGKE